MAHLEVEPKPGRPWWIWVLLVVVLIALAVLLYNKYADQQVAVNHHHLVEHFNS